MCRTRRWRPTRKERAAHRQGVRRELMLILFACFALWAVPIAAARRSRGSPNSWALIGATFGLVVSPASLGTYGVGMILAPILVGVPLVFLGLPLAMFHGPPGFHIATSAGLRYSSGVVEGIDHVTIESINAGIWSVAYGSLGLLSDLVRRKCVGTWCGVRRVHNE